MSRSIINGRDQFENLDFNAYYGCSSLRNASLFPELEIMQAHQSLNIIGLDNHHLTYGYYHYSPPNSSPSFMNRAQDSFAASIVGNSRFLKPVQSLLQELVDVAGGNEDDDDSKINQKFSSELKAEFSIEKGVLLSFKKHELLMKITKLVDLLDEVGLSIYLKIMI